MDSKRKPWEYSDGVKVKRAGTDTWIIWSHMPIGPLWKVVALHCGLDPDAANKFNLEWVMSPKITSTEWLYQRRIDLAIAHIKNGTLECFERNPAIEKSDVRLPAYAAWAESMGAGHELPPQFPKSDVQHKDKQVSKIEPGNCKWPWGSHDTKLLRLFAEVGQFWKPESEGGNYDPADPTTAPTNAQIEEWLKERGVSIKAREVMATMLRADNMPSGPRRFKAEWGHPSP